MTLHLPPAEPPAEDVQAVREMLQTAREQLEAAEARLRRVEQLDHPYLRPTARMLARVITATRQREVELWVQELGWIEDEARRLGIQP